MIRKIRSNIAALGWRETAYYTLSRALRAIGMRLLRYDLVAQPVPHAPLLPAHRGRSITVRQLMPGDGALRGLPLDDAVLEFRFRQDAVCFGAFQGERVVGCLWLCLNGYNEDEVRCRFVPVPPEQAAWDFDVYVDPAHRAGLVFARLWDSANAFLRDRGIAWSMSRISRFNQPSVASHRALGAVPCARLTVLRAGVWQMCCATTAPHIHFSFKADTMPVYRVPVPGPGAFTASAMAAA